MHESDLCLGLTDETLEHLGKIGPKAQKTSRRDLAVVLSQVTLRLGLQSPDTDQDV